MKLVFCGTPQFAVATLERLVKHGHEVALVVTQPDRPRGRGMEVAYSPVKQSALKLGLPVTQPEKIKTNADFREQIETIGPQAIIVVGYGRIIPQWMIELPPMGNLNVHASLLPKYRGAAPIQWAIAMGEHVTGVTVMRIDAGLDTGDMLAQAEEHISGEDTAVTLGPRLAVLGAELMAATLPRLERGEITPQKQDDARATLAPILKKEDGLLDFRRTAQENLNRLRGFQPWPGAHTTFRGKQMTVHSARAQEKLEKTLGEGAIGMVGESVFVGCGRASTLELIEVQLEGKKRMRARDFVNGYRPHPGEMLGAAPTDTATTSSTTD
jgi:methionyl-tRNA formyltransferase